MLGRSYDKDSKYFGAESGQTVRKFMNSKERLRQLAQYIIKIDDREIVDFYPFLTQVNVETSRTEAAVCTLTFVSMRNERGMWNIQDSALWSPWRRISIEAVFGTYRAEIMRGFIRSIQLDYPDDMSASVTVTGQDESILLYRTHVQKTYSTFEQPLKDELLIRELLKPNWTGNQVNAAEGTTCGNLYFEGTPISLIRDRAALNGYEFFIREGKVYFGPPRLTGEPQPVISVYAGKASNCSKFSVRQLPDGIQPEVKPGKSCSSVSQAFGTTVACRKEHGLWHIHMPRGHTLSKCEARAKTNAKEAAWKISATGELDGSAYGHVLLPNRTVRVDGIGSTYSGLWYVDEVKHSFSADGYRQSFKLLRHATWEMGMPVKPEALAQLRQR